MRKPPTDRMKLAAATLTLTALLALGPVYAVPLEEEFCLHLGESESVDEGNLALKFSEIARDNRCPRDVQCIVAGAAVAVFRAETSGGESADLTFEVPPGGSADQSFEGFEITVVAIDPQTHSKRRIELEDYIAKVLVER